MNVQLIDNCPTVNRWIVAAFVALFLMMIHGIWYVGIKDTSYRVQAINAIAQKSAPFTVQCGTNKYEAVLLVGEGKQYNILTKDYAEIKVIGETCKKAK